MQKQRHAGLALAAIFTLALTASCDVVEDIIGDIGQGGSGGSGGGEGKICGGFGPAPRPGCATGFKCNDQPGKCGSQAADAPGVCEAVPTACTKEYRPVCGCDGKTYGNDCMRKAAGVSLDHSGECNARGGRQAGEFCGGIAGFTCAAGLFCEAAAGACKVADGGGVCKPIPQVCLTIYKPVCSCDGKTYGNDCERQVAGAALDHEGACN